MNTTPDNMPTELLRRGVGLDEPCHQTGVSGLDELRALVGDDAVDREWSQQNLADRVKFGHLPRPQGATAVYHRRSVDSGLIAQPADRKSAAREGVRGGAVRRLPVASKAAASVSSAVSS
jgi:hypothetical protein